MIPSREDKGLEVEYRVLHCPDKGFSEVRLFIRGRAGKLILARFSWSRWGEEEGQAMATTFADMANKKGRG